MFGLVITIIMLALRWRAAILLGIIFATVFAIIMNYAWGQNAGFLPGQAVIPSDVLAMPDFSLVGAFDFGAFGKLGVTAAVLWIFSLMLSDFFDTMGTLVGVGGQAGYLDKKGDLPQVNRALLVDSVAAAAGGAVSASSATTYIESGAGVGAGRPDRLGGDRRRRPVPRSPCSSRRSSASCRGRPPQPRSSSSATS